MQVKYSRTGQKQYAINQSIYQLNPNTSVQAGGRPRCGNCLFWSNLWVVNPGYSRLNCFGLLKKNVDLAMLLFKLSTIGKWTLSFKIVLSVSFKHTRGRTH